jgi:hypothetical protein
MRCKRSREDGRQCGDRSVDQPRKPWLDQSQHEHPPARLFFFAAFSSGDLLFFERCREFRMLPLDVRQIAQQFLRRRVRDFFHRAVVESPRLQLHLLHLFSHGVDSQRPHQPSRPAVDETFHVLAADQQNVDAESLPVHVDEHLPVARFLGLHLIKRFCRRRVTFPQSVGEIAVNAAVFLFQLNGERQDFPLAEVLEIILSYVDALSSAGTTSRLYCVSS